MADASLSTKKTDTTHPGRHADVLLVGRGGDGPAGTADQRWLEGMEWFGVSL